MEPTKKPDWNGEESRPIDRRVEFATVGVFLLVAAIAMGIHLSQKPQVEIPPAPDPSPMQVETPTVGMIAKVLGKTAKRVFVKKADGQIDHLSFGADLNLENMPEGEVVEIGVKEREGEDELISFSNPSFRTGRGRFTTVAKETATVTEPSGTSREVSLATNLRSLEDAGGKEVEFTLDLSDTIVFWDFIPKDDEKE